MYTIIIINIFYFFSLIYKNERKKNLDDKVTFTKKNKKIFNIDDTDINKILVSKKEPYVTCCGKRDQPLLNVVSKRS